MRLWSICAIGTLVVSLAYLGTTQSNAKAQVNATPKLRAVEKTNSNVRTFMRKKLVAADQILEGLTSPDMSLVQKGAISMIHMNKEAMWASFKTPSYAQDSADFVRTAERLINLAKRNDIEGVSHTYAQLTVQCVTCHRRVRHHGVASTSKRDAIVHNTSPADLGFHFHRELSERRVFPFASD